MKPRLDARMELLKDVRVLHIEEDPGAAAALEAVVGPRVRSLSLARNGQEGLLAFARYDPDLVVADVVMATCDGLAMLAAIREMRPDTPVIVTSALDDPAALRQSIRLGVASYVLKPVQPEELLEVLIRNAAVILRHRESAKQGRLSDLLLNSLPHPAMLIDRERLTVLSANADARRLGFLTSEEIGDPVIHDILRQAESEDSPLLRLHSGSHADFKDVPAFGRHWDINLELVTDSIALFFATDVTARRRMEQDLEKEKAFIAAILEHSYDGIGVAGPDGRLKFLSPGMERLFGRPAKELVDAPEWTATVIPDRDQRDKVAALLGTGASGGRAERVFPFVRKDGAARWCRFHVSRMPGGDLVINGQDITSLKEAEERIRHMAMHDPLTGLPNRQLFTDRANQALAHAKRYRTVVGLLYVDLDRFKRINDLYGHDCGDHVLRETAERLRLSVREPDTVARIGGDEFVVILPEIGDPEHAREVARRILDALSRPLVVQGESHALGASIGAGFYPRDGSNVEELLRKADKAMYHVKRHEGSGVRCYGELPDGADAPV